MKILKLLASHGVFLVAVIVISSDALAFTKPLDTPSERSDDVRSSPMVAVTSVGSKLVAVGQRGHIILSHDGGESWIQADVPVSSDLVAVSFASELQGWAVGHSGVVVHTADGGLTWTLQLDGHETSKLITSFYKERIGNEAFPDADVYLQREEILVSYGGTQPLMDVYFEDEKTGYAVGIFNRLLKTVDGGKSWEPWAHRIDNPGELHFYSINAGDNGVYITGEQGQVWRLDDETKHFVEVPTPYSGTLFGSVNTQNAVVAFGMRGSIYRSLDNGENWNEVVIQSEAGITDGMVMQDGRIVLTNLAGDLLVSIDHGETFKVHNLENGMPFFGLAAMDAQSLVLTGSEGVRQQTFMPLANKKMDTSNLMVKSHYLVNKPSESRHALQ